MDWAFFPVNGLGLNLSNFWKEKLSFGFSPILKSAAKSSEKISEIWKLREKWVNGLGFFAYFYFLNLKKKADLQRKIE